MNEHDLVKSTRDIKDNIPKGTNGTIVHIWKAGERYEVEFTNKFGVTISVESVNHEDIESINK